MSSRIVAMGGGGFSMEPDNPRLDDHLLSLTGKARPRVLFVPTASGDADGYIVRFYAAFAGRSDARHLSLFRRTDADLASVVRTHDVVYVGGGSTPNLLAVWRAHGLDRVLADACRDGVVLAGLSAGAMCWFEHGGVSDSLGPGFAPLPDGLGLLRGSMCPHYDSEPGRRPAFEALIARGAAPDGYAADDGAALVFVDGALLEVVTSRPDARAWRVRRTPDGAAHDALPTRFL